MRNTAITQIILIIVAGVIIFSYIRPTFSHIQSVQEETYQYADATAKANEYNDQLQQLLNRAENFSTADIEALETFLPSNIEPLRVMNDVEYLALQNNMQVLEMKAGDLIMPNTEVLFDDYYGEQEVHTESFSSQEFTVTVEGLYQDFVSFLQNVERTPYILEVKSMEFGSDGEVSADPAVSDTDAIRFTLIVVAKALASNQ